MMSQAERVAQASSNIDRAVAALLGAIRDVHDPAVEAARADVVLAMRQGIVAFRDVLDGYEAALPTADAWSALDAQWRGLQAAILSSAGLLNPHPFPYETEVFQP